MSSNSVGELVNSLYGLLEPYDQEVRCRALRAVAVLFGDTTNTSVAPANTLAIANPSVPLPPNSSLQLTESAQKFFDDKQPNSKIEELGVAVRFLEVTTRNEAITKSDVEDVILAARRNFDGKNFRRDLENAKAKGLFNRSKDPRVLTLSYYGQKYVDGLPNREALAQIRKPTRSKRRKPAAKEKHVPAKNPSSRMGKAVEA